MTTDETLPPIEPAPRTDLDSFVGRTFYHLFDASRGAVVAPRWLGGQYRRLRPGDGGAARSLLLDVFPSEDGAVPFDLSRKGDTSIHIIAPDGEDPATMEIAGEGTLLLEDGELVIADETDIVAALTQLRQPEAICESLGPIWLVPPGRYAVTVWRERKKPALAVRLQPAEADAKDDAFFPHPVELEIRPELDLHTFDPADARDVIDEYCHLAAQKGFPRVRIIHGRGVGQLRQMTHALLAEHPAVASFGDAPEEWGGAGATIAWLHVADEPDTEESDTEEKGE